MILKAVTTNGNQAGLITGTDTFKLSSKTLGGVNISTDGTNAAAVVVRKDGPEGEIIFQQSTKTPVLMVAPIQAASVCYCSVSGTGASAQFFEWQG